MDGEIGGQKLGKLGLVTWYISPFVFVSEKLCNVMIPLMI